MGFIKSHDRIKNLLFRKLSLILVIINGRLKNLQRIFFPGIYNKGIFFFFGLLNICFINDLRLRNVSKEDDYNKDILHYSFLYSKFNKKKRLFLRTIFVLLKLGLLKISSCGIFKDTCHHCNGMIDL